MSDNELLKQEITKDFGIYAPALIKMQSEFQAKLLELMKWLGSSDCALDKKQLEHALVDYSHEKGVRITVGIDLLLEKAKIGEKMPWA
ncbi:hypothetical protein ACMAZF_20145 (plasmid) [Psychrobium sp. nBUS_13]|uniref:hypothetical protein n=1 Tax=Psychrobium sp. nBUS_13 TaxID=3395319 RepID=UPI003EC0F1C6